MNRIEPSSTDILLSTFFGKLSGYGPFLLLTLIGIAFLFILFHYVRAIQAWREGKVFYHFGETLPGPEPAFPVYFFGQSFLDFLTIVGQSGRTMFISLTRLVNWDSASLPKLVLIISKSILVLFLFAVLIVIVPIFSLIAIAHLLLTFLVSVGALLIMLFLRLVDGLSFHLDQTRVLCPHPECHQPIKSPHHQCPSCGATHRKLRPGRFGLFYRRCACRKARIPTLDILGKNDLPGLCPHCNQSVETAWLNTRVRGISLFGAGYSGKTHLAVMAIQGLFNEDQREEGTLIAAQTSQVEIFKQFSSQLKRGMVLKSDADVENFSLGLLKSGAQRGKTSLLIEDPDSKAFSDLGHQGTSQLLRKAHGYVFVIDPFSIQDIAADYQTQISHLASTIFPGVDSPSIVYSRFIKKIDPLGNKKLPRRPMAVMITKIDALSLITEGGTNFSTRKSLHPGSSSSAIRQWLLNNGETSLVRRLESDFPVIQYFCGTALGQLADSGRPAQPAGVLAPFKWLIQRQEKSENLFSEPPFWRTINARFAMGMISAILFFTLAGFGLNQSIQPYLSSPPLWLIQWQENVAAWRENLDGLTNETIAAFSGPLGGYRYVRPHRGLHLRSDPTAESLSLLRLPRSTILALETDPNNTVVTEQDWVKVKSEEGVIGWVFAGPGWENLSLRNPETLKLRNAPAAVGPPEKILREAISEFYRRNPARVAGRELRSISNFRYLQNSEKTIVVEVRLVEKDRSNGEMYLEKREFTLALDQKSWAVK